jgi:hypothetical protein
MFMVLVYEGWRKNTFNETVAPVLSNTDNFRITGTHVSLATEAPVFAFSRSDSRFDGISNQPLSQSLSSPITKMNKGFIGLCSATITKISCTELIGELQIKRFSQVWLARSLFNLFFEKELRTQGPQCSPVILLSTLLDKRFADVRYGSCLLSARL